MVNSRKDNTSYYSTNKKKLPTPLLIVITVICIIILGVGGIFVKNKLDISSLTKKADSFVEMEDFEGARKVYSELYTKTGDPEYKTKMNSMKINQEVKDTMDDAKKQEQNGNLVKAIVIYKMVPKEDDKNFKKAAMQIDTLKGDIVKKASTFIDAGNNAQASTILSEYLAIEPDDKTAVELYKKVSGKNETQIKEVVVDKTVPVYVNSGGSANAVANAITGTYQYITSSKANARSAPSKGSAVVGTLYRGDSVYVYSTYVESEKRIWCKTDYGWVSYNTMNNTIR